MDLSACCNSIYLLDEEHYLILRHLGVEKQVVLPMDAVHHTAALVDERFFSQKEGSDHLLRERMSSQSSAAVISNHLAASLFIRDKRKLLILEYEDIELLFDHFLLKVEYTFDFLPALIVSEPELFGREFDDGHGFQVGDGLKPLEFVDLGVKENEIRKIIVLHFFLSPILLL